MFVTIAGFYIQGVRKICAIEVRKPDHDIFPVAKNRAVMENQGCRPDGGSVFR